MRRRSAGINGEGELRGQPANPGSPGVCVCVCLCEVAKHSFRALFGVHILVAHCTFTVISQCSMFT